MRLAIHIQRWFQDDHHKHLTERALRHFKQAYARLEFEVNRGRDRLSRRVRRLASGIRGRRQGRASWLAAAKSWSIQSKPYSLNRGTSSTLKKTARHFQEIGGHYEPHPDELKRHIHPRSKRT